MSYLCPACRTPLRKIRTDTNSFFSEEVWNCSTCRKNHYLHRDTWLGAQPILADEGI
jgi:uncharacterized protein with PIN domain